MEYAEQIVKENQKLRIAKNDLRIENEQLKKGKFMVTENIICYLNMFNNLKNMIIVYDIMKGEKMINYKRFVPSVKETKIGEIQVIKDSVENKIYANVYSICDLMNNINDRMIFYRTTIDKRIVDLEEKNNQLSKDLKSLLNEKRELENKLQIYEHELNCCDGLYASDNKEFKDYFRLDFSNIISYPVGDDE